jgi:hypothetical protein
VIYQGYEINGYTFYTEQQDNKNTYKIVVYMLMLMILWAKTKTCAMVKIPLFCCNWVDACNTPFYRNRKSLPLIHNYALMQHN